MFKDVKIVSVQEITAEQMEKEWQEFRKSKRESRLNTWLPLIILFTVLTLLYCVGTMLE
jgi:hypothetical protein